jgi:hypothetical protein
VAQAQLVAFLAPDVGGVDVALALAFFTGPVARQLLVAGEAQLVGGQQGAGVAAFAGMSGVWGGHPNLAFSMA